MEGQRPKSVYLRFLNALVDILHEKAPKNPSWVGVLLGMFYDIMVYSAEEILTGADAPNPDSEAYKIGM